MHSRHYRDIIMCAAVGKQDTCTVDKTAYVLVRFAGPLRQSPVFDEQQTCTAVPPISGP